MLKSCAERFAAVFLAAKLRKGANSAATNCFLGKNDSLAVRFSFFETSQKAKSRLWSNAQKRDF
jgi:hypothetical protein